MFCSIKKKRWMNVSLFEKSCCSCLLGGLRVKTSIVVLTNHSGFQVHKDSPGDMLPSTSFTEEGSKWVISTANGLITWHLSIWLNSVFQAIQFPASIAHLHASLADMDRDTLTLQKEEKVDFLRVVSQARHQAVSLIEQRCTILCTITGGRSFTRSLAQRGILTVLQVSGFLSIFENGIPGIFHCGILMSTKYILNLSLEWNCF